MELGHPLEGQVGVAVGIELTHGLLLPAITVAASPLWIAGPQRAH